MNFFAVEAYDDLGDWKFIVLCENKYDAIKFIVQNYFDRTEKLPTFGEVMGPCVVEQGVVICAKQPE